MKFWPEGIEIEGRVVGGSGGVILVCLCHGENPLSWRNFCIASRLPRPATPPKLADVMAQGSTGAAHAPGIETDRLTRLQRVNTSAASPAGCMD